MCYTIHIQGLYISDRANTLQDALTKENNTRYVLTQLTLPQPGRNTSGKSTCDNLR